jgi:ATP-binding cassette subfamily B protein
MKAAAAVHLPTWRLAARVARYRLGLFASTVVLLAVSNALLLLIGLLLQRVFDTLSDTAAADLGVSTIIAALVAVEVARMAVVWAGVVWIACWERMSGLLRLNLLHAQMQSGGLEAGTTQVSSGEAVSHLRDDTDDFLRFLDTAIWVAGKAVFSVGAVVVMVRIDLVVTVAVALPLVAMVVAAQVLGRRIRACRRASRRATAAVTGFLGEVFGAVQAVKAAHAAPAVLQRSSALNQHRGRAALRDQLLTESLDAFNITTVDISIGLVLLLASSAMRRGDFTVGDLVLFASYASTMVALPFYGGRMLVRYRQAGVAAERLAALLPAGSPAALVASRPLYVSGREPPAPASVPATRHDPLQVLEVRGLSATHPTSGRGLSATHSTSGRGVRDIDLVLEQGTFTVVSGPVGAGKTTLLRALLGLMPAVSGTVTWNGHPVADRAAFMIPPRCAYVPQVPQLFSESLADNVLLGADPGAVDLDAALRTAVLEADVHRMPNGLATRVGARGVRLSGGQVQRVAIARALARRPDLLVLDDVSSSLDVDTERALWDGLLTDRPATLLVVSNRPATIAYADQVITLDHGRVQPTPDRRVHLTVPTAGQAWRAAR